MSIPQTSRILKIDVGSPPSSLSKNNDNEWGMVEVRYHGFRNLTTTRTECVESPEFTCFGRKWCLKIFPGGDSTSEEGMVGIFLYNMGNESIKVQFGLSVKGKGHTSKMDWLSPYKGNEFSPIGTGGNDGLGSNNFCKRTQVIENLVDGTFVIEVRMRQFDKSAICTPFIPDNPIAKTILSMFNDEESSDVVFEVGSDESGRNACKRAKTTTQFHAHRIILQKSCSSALLGELCKPGTNALAISDVKPDIFRHLLYYVYGGKIADEELKSNAKEIIDAADKYGIVGLKLEAEAAFVTSTTITFENAIDNLLYADATNCALLKEAVLDFIAENGSEASRRLSFEHVPGNVIPYLLAAMTKGKRNGNDANGGAGIYISKDAVTTTGVGMRRASAMKYGTGARPTGRTT